jgi:hypothetical protein
MAHWGEAIANIHQINGEPSSADLTAGRTALAKADVAREQSPREAGYIKATHRFFDGYDPKKYFDYAQRYADTMGALSGAYPTDVEARLFYALGLLAGSAHRVVEHSQAVERKFQHEPEGVSRLESQQVLLRGGAGGTSSCPGLSEARA